MFRHKTSAAFTVLIFPGEAPRHGIGFEDQGGPGTGFPHVRCRLADQYGISEAGSGSVSMDPFTLPSGLSVVLRFRVLEDGSERDVERYSCSVSESESGLVREPFPQGPAPVHRQTSRQCWENMKTNLLQTLGQCEALDYVLQACNTS